MRALLDVNILIALFDEAHVANEACHEWLERHLDTGIATCPLTENGLVRILSHPNYSSILTQSPARVLEALADFVSSHDHQFWADDLSLRDFESFDPQYFVGTRQITDLYLLGLAVKHGGRLVTLDTRIHSEAVRHASKKHLHVIGQ